MSTVLKHRINIISVIIWMAVIFIFSSQVATESSVQSAAIVEFVKNTTSINLSESVLTFIVRKSAHIFLYFVLGILIFNATKDIKSGVKRAVLLSILVAFAYAITDEVHQLFISGRSGEVSDVLIDTIASSVGVGICYLFYKLRAKSKLNKGLNHATE